MKGGIEVERTSKDRTDFPFDCGHLDTLLKSASDPEVSLGAFAVGVMLGPGVRMHRLPALYAKKRRWKLPDQADPVAWQEDRGAGSLEAEMLLVGGMVRRMQEDHG